MIVSLNLTSIMKTLFKEKVNFLTSRMQPSAFNLRGNIHMSNFCPYFLNQLILTNLFCMHIHGRVESTSAKECIIPPVIGQPSYSPSIPPRPKVNSGTQSAMLFWPKLSALNTVMPLETRVNRSIQSAMLLASYVNRSTHLSMLVEHMSTALACSELPRQ